MPSALTVSHLPHGPTAKFSLHNTYLRQDLPAPARGTVSESYPRLIFDGFTTPLGHRLAKILKHLWPPLDPVTPHTPLSKIGNRVITFRNEADAIEVRHHVFVRGASYDSIELGKVVKISDAAQYTNILELR